ncbi:MAG TPA: hypothetical protein VGE84_04955, partial [Allosphingosinicella sp.]
NADDFISQTDRRNMLPELAVNLAAALNREGARPEAEYLLAATARRIEQSIRQTPDRDSIALLAFVRAGQGDREQAIALFERALRQGWFPNGRDASIDLAEEPALASLVADPRFAAIRKRILDHVARERAELGPLKV